MGEVVEEGLDEFSDDGESWLGLKEEESLCKLVGIDIEKKLQEILFRE